MENSDFDKFIQANTQKELKVPDGLNWENMNIPLPEKKRKKRFFFLIFWGILGVATISGAWAYFYINKSTTINKITADNNVDLNGQQTISLDTKTNTVQQSTIQQTDNTTSNDNNKSTKTELSIFDLKSKNNLPTSVLNIKPIENSSMVVDSDNEQSNLGTSTLVVEVPSQPEVKIPSKQNVEISNIGNLNFQLAPSVETLLELNLPTYFQLKLPPRKNKKKMLLLSFGLNSAQSNYSEGLQTDALASAEESFWGESYQFLFQHKIKKDFFGSVGIGYHRLQNTFTFQEDLGSFIEPNSSSLQLQRVHETRNVFYNNFFDFIELKIGGGKNFSFGKNWESQISVHLNPSYKIKSTGRTLNDEMSIITIEDFDAQQKLFWNASADLRLFYNFKNNSLFLGGGYTQSLNSIQFLENSDLRFSPQVLTFNLGLSRKF